MRSVTGKTNVLDLLPEVLYDESRYSEGVPDAVFFPESIHDVQTIIRDAQATSHKVVFGGAQTGITGGAVPVNNCYLMLFSAMNKIRRVQWIDNHPVLFCEPGVSLVAIREFLHSPETGPYIVPGSETLMGKRYFFPPDPTESTAQLGGAVATNASGSRSFRFGSIRNHIAHLTCVLSSGELLQVPRSMYHSNGAEFTINIDQFTTLHIPHPTYQYPEIKNAAGYFNSQDLDLIDILIGSEGTLAAFAEIGIRIYPEIEFLSGMSFFTTSAQAFDFADILRNESQIASIEYFDESALGLLLRCKLFYSDVIPDFPTGKLNAVLWEYMENSPDSFESRVNDFEKALHQCGSTFEDTWSGFDPHQLAKLKGIRHLVPEMINLTIAQYKQRYSGIRKIATDTAVPPPFFRRALLESLEMIRKESLQFVLFGHLGDFHLHLNVIPANEKELDAALRVYDNLMSLTINYSGTVSAEHGIGKLKKKFFQRMYTENALREMYRIKSAFDPNWLLNPGTLF